MRITITNDIDDDFLLLSGEPLYTMVSKRYKTTDIVGYLKSILEDAKPYARMKLMFVGIQGIGKTSLLNRLKEEGIINASQ